MSFPKRYDDVEKDDPNDVDGLLTQEMLKLSVQDRNEIQEEIHGVLCLAPEETPQLVEESLTQLQKELDVIPADMKHAYLKSQALCSGGKNTYIASEDFKLRFLRIELFDAPKAAARMVSFLDNLFELFGEDALKRPIRMSDFSTAEMRHIRKGRYQLLPYRDRSGTSGRRVFVMFPDSEWEAIPPFVRSRIFTYMMWTIGKDIETQRAGFVALIWFDPTFTVTKSPAFHVREHQLVSVRASAIHLCTPDTPFYRFRRATLMMRIAHNRSRLKIHIGQPMELRYALQSYGISTDQMPITYSGILKMTYFRQWLRLRQRLEEGQTEIGKTDIIQRIDPNMIGDCARGEGNGMHSDSSWYGSSCDEKSISHDKSDTGTDLIESPFSNDIVFRKGADTSSHPGNAGLRNLISMKTRNELDQQHKEQLLIEHGQTTDSSTASFAKKAKLSVFVSEIIQEIQEMNRSHPRPCRYLVFNEGGWWTELTNENEIHTRIKYIARRIRNDVTKNYRSSISLLNPIGKKESPSSMEPGDLALVTPIETRSTNLSSIGEFNLPPYNTAIQRVSKNTKMEVQSRPKAKLPVEDDNNAIGSFDTSKRRRLHSDASSIFDVSDQSKIMECGFDMGLFSW